MPGTQIALIIPAYNPAVGWSSVLLQHWNEFKEQMPFSSYELILVNDGTENDHFNAEVKIILQYEPATKLIEQTLNKGKGAALRNGIAAANAEFYLLTDIDFPYTTKSMLSICSNLQNAEADITTGNRNHIYYEKVPWLRSRLSLFLRWLIRMRLHLPFDDTQCGLKAMNEKGKKLFLLTKTNRYLYDLEFIVKAAADKSVKIKPIPVELREEIVLRRMSPRILVQEAINFIKIILFRNRL